jgi:hypothetical protein
MTTSVIAEVKERPILFSGPMVRAILEGRKTQTRRVIKPQPIIEISRREQANRTWHVEIEWKGNRRRSHGYAGLENGDKEMLASWAEEWCPYGSIGDHLWVRETWAVNAYYDGRPANGCGPIPEVAVECRELPNAVQVLPDRAHRSIGEERGMWRNPMFMPRWASRINLEIKSIRVEKVQDISEADAIAEGLDPRLCVDIFSQAAGKVAESDCYWLEHEETGEEDSGQNGNYCRACALKRQKRRGKKWMLCGDGGSAMESDGPAYCDCGTPLLMSLTEYGVERELRIEDDPEGKEPQYFPVAGMDARIVANIADGIGDLQPKHYGRLAQIGFATGWNLLNAKRGYSWESNPWVFVITFQKL